MIEAILKALDDASPKRAIAIHLSPAASVLLISSDELYPYIPREEGEIKIRGAQLVQVPEADVPECGFKLIF